MKKFFFTLLVILLPIVANADDSGTCGDNLTYTFVESTGTLTISGTGAMTDYGKYSYVPWYSYHSKILIAEIGDGVTSIGKYAFYNCSSLTSITIPESVTSIGSSTFSGCSNLTSITIPDGVTSIDHGAFSGCSNLTSITIPDGVTSIGNRAFSGCSSLTSITIPDGVTSIGDYAFDCCRSLTSITIPDGVTSIGERVFSDCSSLTSITIPDGVTSIGGYAFWNCYSLTSITIPDGVTSIGEYAFRGCSSFFSITIPESVTSIGYGAFSGCSSLTSITIPDEITTIEESTFQDCSKLKSVILPEKLYMIKKLAFSGCKGMESITIPAGVEYIYQEAFKDCNSLKTVKVLAETPPFAYDNSFSNYDAELSVPEKSIPTYQETNPWSKFANFKTLTGEDVEVKTCATPTISYSKGEISFECETEGVDFVSSITDSDIANYNTAKININVTYNISVYATKEGYKDSEVAKATLCWIDVEPKTEGVVGTDISNVKALPVVVQVNGGMLTVNGADDGTMVEVYTIAGAKVGNAVTSANTATVNISQLTDNVIIVKVGGKAIKVMMK